VLRAWCAREYKCRTNPLDVRCVGSNGRFEPSWILAHFPMEFEQLSLRHGDVTGVRAAARLSHTARRAGVGARDVEPMLTDPDSAKAALHWIVVPQDALDRIAGMAPQSSLIVTDEGLSSETGKGTDFVVLLSGEPQGGIKT
jgi:hypothetical protein